MGDGRSGTMVSFPYELLYHNVLEALKAKDAADNQLRQMLISAAAQIEALLIREGQPLPAPIRAQASLVVKDARELLASLSQDDRG